MVVQGNPRVYKALRNQMADIYEELKRLERCSEANDELLYTIQMIAEIMNGLKGNVNEFKRKSDCSGFICWQMGSSHL